MANTTGGRRFRRTLGDLGGPEMRNIVGRALYAAGDLIATEAHISITRGSASGRKKGKHKHVPSKPGEPPNNDTGVLARGIETVQLAPLVVEVSSNAPYSNALEFGTSKMAARPFMRPARDQNAEKARRIVIAGINRLLREP